MRFPGADENRFPLRTAIRTRRHVPGTDIEERPTMAQVTVDFSGTTVFVAGGTSGINLGIARAFAAAGARVGVESRRQEKVDAAVLGSAWAPAAPATAADVRDRRATARRSGSPEAFGDRRARLRRGRQLPGRGAGHVPERLQVGGRHRPSRHLPRDEGRVSAHAQARAGVINISAPQAFLPMALQSHVCAAKAGVDMVTRVLAIEWGAEGIRVNGVVPGPIEGTEGMARPRPDPGGSGDRAHRTRRPLG